MEITEDILSEATNGKGVEIRAESSPGTLIHTAVSGTTDWDEIWIYIFMHDFNRIYKYRKPLRFYIQWGGTTDPDDTIITTSLCGGSGVRVIPGLILNNSAAVRIYVDAGIPETARYLWANGFIRKIRN